LSLEAGDRVAIIGKNGKGKSTLLNLIAGELQARSGIVKAHPGMRLAHFGQTNINRLHRGMTVEEEIMAAVPDHSRGTARGICGLMMFQGDDALKRVEILSGGERARVLLGKLLVSPANLVLLDEPTNHLDMESIESLTEALLAFSGGVLIVTHNERVLHALATKMVIFDRGRASWFDGSYRDFLDRVGWSDEDEVKGRKRAAKNSQGEPVLQKPAEKKAHGKELRQKRAAIVAARSKDLRPLKKKIHTVEDSIVVLEPRFKQANLDLERASQTGDREGIVRHSTDAAELQKQIEVLFAELESATTDHDEHAREFDQQLEQLNG